jgi:hypothetical protein
MTPTQLPAIAAAGHDAPPGAHLLIVGVLLVGVVVVLLATRRRRGPTPDELRDRTPTDGAERERSEQ